MARSQPAVARFGPRAVDAFAVVYSEHSVAVYNVVRRICGPAYADDVTQEVFLDLWRHPGQFEAARGSLRGYLLTVGYRRAVDVSRSETARRAREERRHQTEPASDDEIDADLLEAETERRISDALDRLPLLEKEAIVTAFYGDCTYRQAAAVLDQPEGTVKTRIRSGLRRLQIPLRDLHSRPTAMSAVMRESVGTRGSYRSAEEHRGRSRPVL